jgi:ubiquinol-cytochrome c reductase cytochrome b subunit
VWPFVEKLFSRDKGDQNVLRLPYEQPILTAGGAGLFTFLLVLLVAGGDDFLALALQTSVIEVRTILRILVLAAPPCAAALAYFVCLRVRDRKAALAAAARAQKPAAGVEEPVSLPIGEHAGLRAGD